MEVLLSKAGRQISFPTYPIVRQNVVTTLGFGESEINKLLNYTLRTLKLFHLYYLVKLYLKKYFDY